MFEWLTNLLQGGNSNFGSLGGSATQQPGAPMTLNPISYNPQGGPLAGAPNAGQMGPQINGTTPGTPPPNPPPANPMSTGLGILGNASNKMSGALNNPLTKMGLGMLTQKPPQQVQFPQWMR